MSRAWVAACGVLVVLILVSDLAGAQIRLPTGSHLRVRRQGLDGSGIAGRLRSMSNDSITIAPDADSAGIMPFAVGDIAKLEIENDAHTRDQAAVVLGVIGASAGLTTAALWCRHNQTDCNDEMQKTQQAADNDSTYFGLPLLMVIGGAAIGSLIGYVIAPQPHWDLVVIPTRTSTNTGAPRMLFNVGLRYSFGERRRR